MIMMQVSESKKREMNELAEDMLYIGGKLMQCIESLHEEESEMGERQPRYYDEPPMTDGNNRIGWRDHFYPEREYEERRGRSGRYARYK